MKVRFVEYLAGEPTVQPMFDTNLDLVPEVGEHVSVGKDTFKVVSRRWQISRTDSMLVVCLRRG